MSRQHVPAAAVSIRAAKSADLSTAEVLIQSAGSALDPDIKIAVTGGVAGSIVAAGQVGGRFAAVREAERVMRDAPQDPLVSLIVATVSLFVAEQDGEVVGALLAAPPQTIIHALADRARSESIGDPTSAICLDLTKLNALGVIESRRGAGIGRRLLDYSVRAYRSAGYFAMYGQFDENEAQLETLYAAAGFIVLPPLHTIDFGDRFGNPLTIAPGPQERLFGIML